MNKTLLLPLPQSNAEVTRDSCDGKLFALQLAKGLKFFLNYFMGYQKLNLFCSSLKLEVAQRPFRIYCVPPCFMS
jgi:hypothetical protein